jgi:outer membrane protein assembly factor BamB
MWTYVLGKMKMRKRFLSILLLVIFLLGSVFFGFSGSFNVASGNDSSSSTSGDPNSWSMFHNDLAHSGCTNSSGVWTNRTLWTYSTNDTFWESPSVVDGIVYVGSEHNGWVYALDASSGALLWTYATDGSVTSCPAVAGGVVYVGFVGGVDALNAYSGNELWSFTTGKVATYSSPAVVDGVVYVGSGDNSVYALNADSGDLIWNFTTGNLVYSSPAVVNGVVYIGSFDDNVYALNASNGQKLWNYTTGGPVYSSPVVEAGVVYVGSNDYDVYALNAFTGSKLWSYRTGNSVESSPTFFSGILIVGSDDGNVYVFNSFEGIKLGSSTTGANVLSSPALVNSVVYVDPDTGGAYYMGLIYVGSNDGSVYAINPSNSGKVWSYNTSSPVYSSPAIADGAVYVCSGNVVYAFGPLSALPNPTPTPTASPSPTPTPIPTSTPFPTPSPTPIEQQILTHCTISAAPNPVQIYQNVTVNMSITPAPPTPLTFNNITCTIIRPDGTVINNLLNSNSDGSLNLSFTPTQSGTWILNLNFHGQNFANNTQYMPSGNQTTLTTLPMPTPTPTPTPTPATILPTPSLSFDCISSTTNSGFNVEIQGTLAYNGTGISNDGIQLSYSVTSGATWQDLAYANTGDNGSFSVVWMPSASGNYAIRATFLGNSVYSGVSATNNFEVAPFDNQAQNVFSVTSNSTLTSLTFDSAKNELSFGVSGTEGTTGYTQVCIPQSLVPDISKLNVILDNNTVNYDSFSKGNDWIITFAYHHSSHLVVVTLGASPTVSPSISPAPTVAPTVAPASTIAPSVTSQPTQAPTASPPAITVPEFPSSIALSLLITLGISSIAMIELKNRKLRKK